MAVIAIVLTAGAQARGELWCGNGRGTPLDHPCTDQDTAQDPAVAAIVDKYSGQWMAVHGVWQVSAGTNQTGTPMEIRVYVEPQQLADARNQIPSEVEGVPVAFVAKATPKGTGLGGFLQVKKADTYDPEAAERQEKDQMLRAAFSNAMQAYGRTWNDLPGVIGVGPGKCKGAECDFSSIKIVVQAQFLDDVKTQIPDAVDGIPVVFIPYNGTDQ
jgi:hypothetical protein